ncbi:response regulator receiver domain-containing protein [Methylomonas methanica]|uniref:Response regulatory domain-containing protein n=3 Tax=Methylococcaceae TaxID=403 RepID=A0A126T8X0_9GAMM|nr:response regulator [Methylomonas denitrificans]AMK78512.1 hypothetical protein JT25_018795 [Methylomonas denitrificans]OAI09116.1 hypothetical protein A1342_13420 [Methylomonas methanica]TCV82279.1 response regulator receiver domain-containing protein [Methylomonas methanica]
MSLHANIHEAKDGKEALEYCQFGYDIVFLDLVMPGISGMKVLEKIKEDNQEQFVVVITGEPTAENVKRVMELGGDGFVAKPYTLDKLKAVIARFHDRSLRLKHTLHDEA